MTTTSEHLSRFVGKTAYSMPDTPPKAGEFVRAINIAGDQVDLGFIKIPTSDPVKSVTLGGTNHLVLTITLDSGKKFDVNLKKSQTQKTIKTILDAGGGTGNVIFTMEDLSTVTYKPIEANDPSKKADKKIKIISDDLKCLTVKNPTLKDDVTLQIITNKASGLLKLDIHGRVPKAQANADALILPAAPYDASVNTAPPTGANSDTVMIGKEGTFNVIPFGKTVPEAFKLLPGDIIRKMNNMWSIISRSQATQVLATLLEAVAGTVDNKGISPKILKEWFAKKITDKSTGIADKGKVPILSADGKLDPSFFKFTSLNIKAPIDPVASSVVPATPKAGDLHFLTKKGHLTGTWTGLVTTPPLDVNVGDMVLFDGTNWHVLASETDLALYLPLIGGKITGPIKYAVAPVDNTELVNKKYADENRSYRKGNYVGTVTAGVLGKVSGKKVAVVRNSKGKYTVTITDGKATDLVIVTPSLGFWVAEDIAHAVANGRVFEFYNGTNLANTLDDPSNFRIEVLT